MRPIKIKKKPLTERDKTFEKLIAIAKPKTLSDEESQHLLNEIRSGNEKAMEKLVDSYEIYILKVAQSIQTKMAIEEMVVTGKKSLTDLATHELGSTQREMFFRFAAQWVRQAILKEMEEKK